MGNTLRKVLVDTPVELSAKALGKNLEDSDEAFWYSFELIEVGAGIVGTFIAFTIFVEPELAFVFPSVYKYAPIILGAGVFLIVEGVLYAGDRLNLCDIIAEVAGMTLTGGIGGSILFGFVGLNPRKWLSGLIKDAFGCDNQKITIEDCKETGDCDKDDKGGKGKETLTCNEGWVKRMFGTYEQCHLECPEGYRAEFDWKSDKWECVKGSPHRGMHYDTSKVPDQILDGDNSWEFYSIKQKGGLARKTEKIVTMDMRGMIHHKTKITDVCPKNVLFSQYSKEQDYCTPSLQGIARVGGARSYEDLAPAYKVQDFFWKNKYDDKYDFTNDQFVADLYKRAKKGEILV